MNLKSPSWSGYWMQHRFGVSTLASGLAAALSKNGRRKRATGDMNVGDGVAHSFYKGKPGAASPTCWKSKVELMPRSRRTFYLASIAERKNEQQTKPAR